MDTLDSDESEIRTFYVFMPKGDSLALGHVLLNYVHKMTRMIRNLLFIEMPKDNPLNLTIMVDAVTLTPRQIESRE